MGVGLGLPFVNEANGSGGGGYPENAFLFLLGEAANLDQLSTGLGGPPVVTGDPVGLWRDTSGNGRDFAQATAGLRGAYLETVPPADPEAVTFAAASNRRLTRSTTAPASGASTFGIKFRLASLPGSGVFALPVRLAAGGSRVNEIYLCNSGGYQPYHWRLDFTNGAGNGVGIATPLDTDWHTLLIVYDGGGDTLPGSYTAYLDGEAVAVVASGSNAGLSSSIGSVGCGDVFGTPFYPFDGDISLVSVYERALDAGEIAAWHAAAGIPSSHILQEDFSYLLTESGDRLHQED